MFRLLSLCGPGGHARTARGRRAVPRQRCSVLSAEFQIRVLRPQTESLMEAAHHGCSAGPRPPAYRDRKPRPGGRAYRAEAPVPSGACPEPAEGSQGSKSGGRATGHTLCGDELACLQQ